MKDKHNITEKHSDRIELTGIPIETLIKMDKKRNCIGISRSAYIKGLINADLKGDKMDNINRAG